LSGGENTYAVSKDQRKGQRKGPLGNRRKRGSVGKERKRFRKMASTGEVKAVLKRDHKGKPKTGTMSGEEKISLLRRGAFLPRMTIKKLLPKQKKGIEWGGMGDVGEKTWLVKRKIENLTENGKDLGKGTRSVADRTATKKHRTWGYELK